jgi:hypothetical protein
MEPTGAFMYWFGVGSHAVWNWRLAFGVARLGMPGSRVLRTKLNRGLADQLREGKLTAAAYRERQRRAVAGHYDQHFAGRQWNGRVLQVRQRRTLLGIPTYCDGRRRSTVY